MRAVFAVLLCLICVLTAPRAGAQGAAQIIDVYVGSGVDELDPHHAVTAAEHAVAGAMHRGLTAYDAGGRLVPDLADSWSVDRSRMTYTFVLKPGLTWSDGRPLTASDVVAGLNRAFNPSRPSPFAAQLGVIARTAASDTKSQTLRVFAPDSRTVEIRLTQPDDLLPDTLSRPVAAPAPSGDPDALKDGMVTSGDYIVSERRGGSVGLVHRTVERSLRIRPTGSVAEAWEASQQSDAFITAAFPIVTVPRPGSRGADARVDSSQALYAYVVNTRRSPLDTLEARHALAMAINRAEVLIDVPVRGAAPAVEFVPPQAKTYQTSYRTPYATLNDEEREAVAEALLADAGYGSDNRFTVRLRVPSGDIHGDVAAAVARMWLRSGIRSDIVVAPLPEHWAALRAGDFDVAFATWPGPRDTPRSFLEPLSVFGGPWNYGAYPFEGLGERLSRAAEAANSDVQAQFFREAEKALIEDQAVFALFYYQPLSLVSSNVTGWQANAAGVHPLRVLGVRPDDRRPRFAPPELPRAVPSLESDD